MKKHEAYSFAKDASPVYCSECKIEIPLERNQLMIMPSSIKHAVDPIKMIHKVDKLSGMGRYCIVRFLKLK